MPTFIHPSPTYNLNAPPWKSKEVALPTPYSSFEIIEHRCLSRTLEHQAPVRTESFNNAPSEEWLDFSVPSSPTGSQTPRAPPPTGGGELDASEPLERFPTQEDLFLGTASKKTVAVSLTRTDTEEDLSGVSFHSFQQTRQLRRAVKDDFLNTLPALKALGGSFNSNDGDYDSKSLMSSQKPMDATSLLSFTLGQPNVAEALRKHKSFANALGLPSDNFKEEGLGLLPPQFEDCCSAPTSFPNLTTETSGIDKSAKLDFGPPDSIESSSVTPATDNHLV